MSIYKQNGFANRAKYLGSLADEYDLDLDMVIQCAELLGPEEDFDGLVSMLQDIDLFP